MKVKGGEISNRVLRGLKRKATWTALVSVFGVKRASVLWKEIKKPFSYWLMSDNTTREICKHGLTLRRRKDKKYEELLDKEKAKLKQKGDEE